WIAHFGGLLEGRVGKVKLVRAMPFPVADDRPGPPNSCPERTLEQSAGKGGEEGEEAPGQEPFPEGLEAFFCPELPADGPGAFVCGREGGLANSGPKLFMFVAPGRDGQGMFYGACLLVYRPVAEDHPHREDDQGAPGGSKGAPGHSSTTVSLGGSGSASGEEPREQEEPREPGAAESAEVVQEQLPAPAPALAADCAEGSAKDKAGGSVVEDRAGTAMGTSKEGNNRGAEGGEGDGEGKGEESATTRDSSSGDEGARGPDLMSPPRKAHRPRPSHKEGAAGGEEAVTESLDQAPPPTH
ncbi:unnamed protein product, partial [Discosporangium mesarthrocarpum]